MEYSLISEEQQFNELADQTTVLANSDNFEHGNGKGNRFLRINITKNQLSASDLMTVDRRESVWKGIITKNNKT